MRNNKGITIITLIVTIIIMLILIGIAINLLIGDNGILKKADIAVDSYNNTVKDEEEKMYQLDDEIRNKVRI